MPPGFLTTRGVTGAPTIVTRLSQRECRHAASVGQGLLCPALQAYNLGLGLRYPRRASHERGKGDVIAGKVFVGNLNFRTTQAELEALFGAVGEVTEVILPVDRTTGRPRGFAFVEFSDASAMPAAISRFDGTELGGRTLRVNDAQERPPRSAAGAGRDFATSPPFPPDPDDPVPYRPDVDGGSRFRPDLNDGLRGRPDKPKGSRRGIRGRKRGF